MKEQLSQDFDDTPNNSDKFNKAMLKVINKYGISEKKCRMQILNSIETDATNLQMQCQGRRKSIWRRDLMHF